MNLSMSTGNRTRVLQDLEKLKQMGINNVRIMAGSEGPNEEPFRMKPALMKEQKVYDESVFEGKRKGGFFYDDYSLKVIETMK